MISLFISIAALVISIYVAIDNCRTTRDATRFAEKMCLLARRAGYQPDPDATPPGEPPTTDDTIKPKG